MKSIVSSVVLASVAGLMCFGIPATSNAQTEVSGRQLQAMIDRSDVAGIRKAIGDNSKLLTTDLPTRQPPLFHAIVSNKPKVIELLLELNSPMDAKNQNKRSPLHEAILRRNDKNIELVLNKTEDINTKDGSETSYLMYAIMYVTPEKALPLMEKLIAKGADVNLANRNKQTALHMSCYYNRPTLLDKLLESGANLDALDNNSNTPFLAACQVSGSLAKKILDKGADPTATNRQGQTALHLLAQSNRRGMSGTNSNIANLEILNLVLDKFKVVDVPDKAGQTPLQMAVNTGNSSLITLLMERGADPNYMSKSPQPGNRNAAPMICIAAQAGSLDAIKALVSGGAKVNVSNPTGDTPLHLAAQASGTMFRRNTNTEKVGRNFVRSIEILLKANADVNAKNKASQTPIQVAAQGDFFAAVELLAKKTTSLDFEIGSGSLLHWCAANGLTNTAKRILSGGSVDVNKTNSGSQTPLHVAAENGGAEIAKLLIDQKAEIEKLDDNGATALLLAAAGGHGAVIKTLIEANADLSKVDSSGQSALHLAAWSGNSEAVAELLKKTPDTNAKTSSGYTPLHAASWAGKHLVVAQLLEAGADANSIDSDGWTPLHKAAYRGHVEAVKALLEKGADKSLKNGVEMTALDMAKSSAKKDNQKTVVELLK